MAPNKNLINNDKRQSIQEIIERFIKHCRSKQLSESTIESYRIRCHRFKNYLLDECETISSNRINDITPQVMEDYRIHLLDKDITNSSVNSYLRTIRRFLYYAMEMGYIEKEFKVSLIKAEKKIKETYTNAELERLLEKPDLNEAGFAEYRNWVIVNWFLATGNRARTVRNLLIKDLNLEEGYVLLREVKNKNEQLIPLPKSLVEILLEYLNFRDGDPGDYLFCTIYGGKLAEDSLGSAIARYNKRRGVDKTSIHLFRHTFAKLWIKNGGDIFRLQKMLGHKSIDMVKEYVNMFGRDLKDNLEEYNPLNNFADNKEYISMDE